MKRLLTIVGLLVAPLGCVANQGASIVRFMNARNIQAGDTCTTEADKYRPSGVLDLSSGGSYLLAMSIESNTTVPNTSVGQVNYQGAGLNDVTFYEIVYSYDFSDPAIAAKLPKEETLPIYAVFRPQSDPQSSYILLEGIGPKAISVLQSAYLGTGNSGTVVSHIKAKVYTSSGADTETNIFRFPITVFSSGYSGVCSGKDVVITKCGYAGQDRSVCTPPPGS